MNGLGKKIGSAVAVVGAVLSVVARLRVDRQPYAADLQRLGMAPDSFKR